MSKDSYMFRQLTTAITRLYTEGNRQYVQPQFVAFGIKLYSVWF